jgi:hypothetical protein
MNSLKQLHFRALPFLVWCWGGDSFGQLLLIFALCHTSQGRMGLHS